MELGISSWTLPWSVGVAQYPRPDTPLNAIGLLDKAVAVDVRRVQIADNLPLDELDERQLDDLRVGAQERRLVLEAGTRGVDPDHLIRYIDIARRIGAPMLRTVLSGRLLGRDQLAQTAASIRSVLPLLEKHHVMLALENNEAFAAAEYSQLITAIASPWVGACLDTANSLGRPETLDVVVKHLARHTVMLHAKDYDVRRVDTRMGFSVVGTAAGEGRVDFPWLLAQLNHAAGNGVSVILEHWPPFQGDIESTVVSEERWLTTSVSYLRGLLSSATMPIGGPGGL